jgi:hypothetical protein
MGTELTDCAVLCGTEADGCDPNHCRCSCHDVEHAAEHYCDWTLADGDTCEAPAVVEFPYDTYGPGVAGFACDEHQQDYFAWALREVAR